MAAGFPILLSKIGVSTKRVVESFEFNSNSFLLGELSLKENNFIMSPVGST